jgi:RimJ/RimL family protein N-acetyltransferase
VLFATVQPGPAGEIRLRAPEPTDVPEIVTACRDPETVRWVDLPDPYRTSDAEGFVTGYAPTLWAGGDGAVFTIADHRDRYAGTIALRLSPADPAVADVGVLVAPHARGRGHCAAALAAVCAWGCTSLGLARIEWKAQVGNLASRRAAERAGFVIEGVARGGLSHRGTRRDAWLGAFVPGYDEAGSAD